ncbi:MAG: hypothetical protein PHG08_03475 [Bacilli bacterium]|jgi:hypothetical protein|nr:hypothetical protein [Bacilli bacterium]HHU24699.1 hypothetical protein [Acholeplasmataceae bacterium]
MRQEKNNRSNRQDQEQAKKRNQATRNANQMANDLLTTPLDPNHDYAHDIELGTYVDARERYDHLYGETVPNVNQVEFAKEEETKKKANQVEFAKEREIPKEYNEVEFGKDESAMKLQERTNLKSGRSSVAKPNSRASTSNKK